MVEISSDVIRGYNDTIILSILMKEPSYGYGISRQIKEISDGKYAIKETTLYSAFTRMEKNRYIESFIADEDRKETERNGLITASQTKARLITARNVRSGT